MIQEYTVVRDRDCRRTPANGKPRFRIEPDTPKTRCYALRYADRLSRQLKPFEVQRLSQETAIPEKENEIGRREHRSVVGG